MTSRLGEILVQGGACTPAAIADALENQVIFGGRLGTNLLDLGAVREADLARALLKRHGVPTLHGELKLDPEAVRLLKPEVADRYDVVPYLLQDRKLALLVCDPTDLPMLDEVAFATGKQVHPIVVPEARLWALLRDTYGLDRQLRGIEVDFAADVRAKPAPGAPPKKDTVPDDLIGEAEFDRMYGKAGFARPSTAAPPAPSAQGAWTRVPPLPTRAEEPWGHAPPPPQDEVEEVVLELTEEVPVEAPSPALTPIPHLPFDIAAEVLAILRAGPGHVAPAYFVPPAAPPRPPEPEPAPVSFQEALSLLSGVDDRRAIATTVLRYARTKFRRTVLFTVLRGEARGWAGLGERLDARAVSRMRLDLAAPGVVSMVVGARAHFLGPLPKTDANVRLLKSLGGGVPSSCFLVPILALGRVVNVLYADNGRGGRVDSGDLGELLILATKIAQSYDVLLARAAQA
ncbi:MAG TPA: hypothetical protein VLT47_10790 [Anaeromyxobacteraceae bacterium]|nr:hypothetical protein [Anaeromyxobacteraceae bacterium]